MIIEEKTRESRRISGNIKKGKKGEEAKRCKVEDLA